MSPRTGRPKIDNPIQKSLTVRLDNDTEELLVKYCKKYNVSKAEVVRQGIHLLLQKK